MKLSFLPILVVALSVGLVAAAVDPMAAFADDGGTIRLQRKRKTGALRAALGKEEEDKKNSETIWEESDVEEIFYGEERELQFVYSFSLFPTSSPTTSLSPTVSTAPSLSPTVSTAPSFEPTVSSAPSFEPTISSAPSLSPTVSTAPSLSPTVSSAPSFETTAHPTGDPTGAPTFAPTTCSKSKKGSKGPKKSKGPKGGKGPKKSKGTRTSKGPKTSKRSCEPISALTMT